MYLSILNIERWTCERLHNIHNANYKIQNTQQYRSLAPLVVIVTICYDRLWMYLAPHTRRKKNTFSRYSFENTHTRARISLKLYQIVATIRINPAVRLNVIHESGADYWSENVCFIWLLDQNSKERKKPKKKEIATHIVAVTWKVTQIIVIIVCSKQFFVWFLSNHSTKVFSCVNKYIYLYFRLILTFKNSFIILELKTEKKNWHFSSSQERKQKTVLIQCSLCFESWFWAYCDWKRYNKVEKWK